MTRAELHPMTLRHHIGDAWVDGQRSAASTNPAFPDHVVAEFPVGGPREIDDAVRTAHAASRPWGSASPLTRGRVLRVAAESVRRDIHRLAALMTSEQGKPLSEAHAEVERTASILAYHAGQVEQPQGEIYAGGTADQEIHTVRTPVGVVAAITVEAVAYGIIGASGQKCTATRRILVAQPILGQFQDSLLDRLSQAQVGDGHDPATEVGPLISAEARTDVLSAVETAVRQGASLPLGDPASCDSGSESGHFVRPALLAGLPRDAPILQTEIFGPVASLHSFHDEHEAITLANASRHGLSAAVFTKDPALARRCLHAVAAGMIHVNNPTTGAEAHVPFGGMKASSSPGPKEQGGTARDFFTELKTAYIHW